MSYKFTKYRLLRLQDQLASAEAGRQRDLARLQGVDGQLALCRRQLRALQAEMDDAKTMVGHYSAVFAPETLKLPGPARAVVGLPYAPAVAPSVFDAGPHALQAIPLQVLLASVEADALRQALHARVEFAGGLWRYAISEQALTTLPRARLIKILSRELATQIAAQLPRSTHPQESSP